jgi:excisionase family DNA binding protein
MMPRAFNPNQICKMLSVGRDTVTKWLNEGVLRSYVIPFSNHRKVLHDDLEQFCKEHGLAFAFEPLAELPRKHRKRKAVVACGIEPQMAKQLKPLIETCCDFVTVEHVEQVFAMAQRDKVCGICLDMALGRRRVLMAGKQILGMRREIMRCVLVYANHEDEAEESAYDTFNVVIAMPADVNRLAQVLTASRQGA